MSKNNKEECSLLSAQEVFDQAKQIKEALGTKVIIGIGRDGVILTPGTPTAVRKDERATEYDIAARMATSLGRHVTYIAEPLEPGESAGFTIGEETSKKQP